MQLRDLLARARHKGCGGRAAIHLPQTDLLLRDVLARMRHDGCGG